MDVHFHINRFTYNHGDTEMYLMTFDRNDISQCIFHIDTPYWQQLGNLSEHAPDKPA